MTAPRGDQGFAVRPQRIDGGSRGGGGRGPVRLPAVAALAAAGVIIGVAWLGPRLTERPSLDLSFLPTPTPTSTVRPTFARPTETPSITPLPAITRGAGPPPAGQVSFLSGTLSVVDLATGQIRTGGNVQTGRDAIFAAPSGEGWWCVCMTDKQTIDHQVRTIELVRFDREGVELSRSEVMTIDAKVAIDEPIFALPVDVAIWPDRRTAVVTTGVLDGRGWTISALDIDLDEAIVIDSRVLGTISAADLPVVRRSPAPSPTIAPTGRPDRSNLNLDGPHVRLAPDGRSAAIWATLQQAQVDDGPGVFATKGWMVSFGPRPITTTAVRPATALGMMPAFCNQIGFAANDRLVWSCPIYPAQPGDTGPVRWTVTSIGLAGQVVQTIDLPVDPDSYYVEPLFDAANGTVYLWDPLRLEAVRIDASTLGYATIRLDPGALSGTDGIPPGGGSARPVWRDADSSVQQYQFQQLSGAPDGQRLYGVGYGTSVDVNAQSQTSLGIFVLDRTTLALLGHWTPAADYISVTPVAGGDLIAASGMPGIDTRGRPAEWEASLTFHDALDGRIVLRLGRLGSDPPVVLAAP